MSINRVVVSGNLTRDPELKSTGGGTPVLEFGIAVNDRRRNPQTGEWEDVPNFVDCAMFGARAESVSRFVGKGSKVSVEGKLRYESWQDRNTGQKRSKLKVVVDEIEFMSERPHGASQTPAQPQYAPQPTNYPPQGQPPAYGQQNAPQGHPVTGYQPQAYGQQQMAGVAQQAMTPGMQAVVEDDIPF